MSKKARSRLAPSSNGDEDELIRRSLFGSERLLTKAEVCERVGRTFPTIWSWMRRGLFPRARIAGRTSVWLESEVDRWMQALPLRAYRPNDEDERDSGD
jgi:predicted DNA-binding transcriptional regulator AlpA